MKVAAGVPLAPSVNDTSLTEMFTTTATSWVTVPVAGANCPLVLVYDAVIVWLPAARVDVVNEACPLTSVIGPASTVAPSLNVTFPSVTNVPLAAVTVAVNVTLWPGCDGFNEEVRATLVGLVAVTLRTTMLSMSTPHACPGRTAVQMLMLSCVYSNSRRAVLPAMPGSFSCTCR